MQSLVAQPQTLQKRELPEYISPDEVALMLGVHKKTIWNHIAKGTLPQPYRIGRRVVRWNRKELIAAIEGRES